MRERDLSDLLSPILVKELRQGVKGPLFAGAMVLLHLFLVLALLASLATRSSREGGFFASALFWVLICVPLLVLMPISGLRSISGELSAKTLDLVLLTRLSAYRIVVGKWAAIVAETVLLSLTILPYVVLRYFLGGIDLWGSLMGLLAALLASAFLSAVATTLSALRISIWLKWGVAAIAVYLILTRLYVMAIGTMVPGSSGGGLETVMWLALIVYAALFLLLLLELGAIAIAPASENHATRVRLLTVAIAGAGAVLFAGLGSSWESSVQVVTTAIVCSVCVAALCEPIRRMPSLYAPFFAPPRAPRRAAGMLLAPGWPSAVPFTIGMCLFLSWGLGWWGADGGVARVVSLIGALMLPLALIKTLPRLFARFPRTLAVYLILLMAEGIPDYVFFAGKILSRPALTTAAQAAASVAPLSYFALTFMPTDVGSWPGSASAVQLVISLAATVVVAAHALRAWTPIAAIAANRTVEPAVEPDLAILDLHRDA